MKLALSTHLLVYSPFGDATPAMLREAGFEAAEIWCMNPHFPYQDGDFVERARSRLEAEGVQAPSVHLPFYTHVDRLLQGESLSIVHPDPQARELALAEASKAILAAARIGASTAVLHVGDMATAATQQNLDLAVEAVERLGALGEENGVDIALENHLSEIAQITQLKGILERAEGRVGICLDVGHSLVQGDPAADAIEAGGLLKNTHIHDNDGSADQHREPGTGTMDWEALFRSFGQAGYEGWHNLEIRDESRGKTPPMELLQMAARARNHLSTIG